MSLLNLGHLTLDFFKLLLQKKDLVLQRYNQFSNIWIWLGTLNYAALSKGDVTLLLHNILNYKMKWLSKHSDEDQS